MKSLVVEDEHTSRLLLQQLLARYGTCDAVADGEAAIAVFRSSLIVGSGYDLVCMDIRMSGRDGIGVVTELRGFEEAQGIASTRGAKIIMVTGVRTTREVFRSFASLCDAYLTKPISARVLEEHLTSLRVIRPAAICG